MGFQVFLEGKRFGARKKSDRGFNPPGSKLICVRRPAFVVFTQARVQIVGDSGVVLSRVLFGDEEGVTERRYLWVVYYDPNSQGTEGEEVAVAGGDLTIYVDVRTVTVR